MALIKCEKCGKEYSDNPQLYENGIIACPHCKNGTNKSKKKKTVRIIAIIVVALAFVSYKAFIVRTVERGNGWKHQIVCFGTCDYDDCTNSATHRISAAGIKDYYCDEHWEIYGNDYFRRLANLDSNGSSSKEATNAKICAEKAVKDNLKSPSTAKFCKYTDMTAENLGGNKWKVTGYVDAQNSFGTTLRQNWTVTLTLTDSGFKDYTVDID